MGEPMLRTIYDPQNADPVFACKTALKTSFGELPLDLYCMTN